MAPRWPRLAIFAIVFLAAFALALYAVRCEHRFNNAGFRDDGLRWYLNPTGTPVPDATLLGPLTAALGIALTGWLGHELGGLRGQLLTSLIALASAPLLFSELTDIGNGCAGQLACWALLIILTVRGSRWRWVAALGTALLELPVYLLAGASAAGIPGRRRAQLILALVLVLVLGWGMLAAGLGWQLPMVPVRTSVHALAGGLISRTGMHGDSPLGYSYQVMPAIPGWIAANPGTALANLGWHVVNLVNPRDTWPQDWLFPSWSVVRYATFPFYFCLGWGIIVPLAYVGWRSSPAADRDRLRPFVLAPILLSVLFAPTLPYRALLCVPLAALAARGAVAVFRREIGWLAIAALAAMMVGWSVYPDVTPRPRFWEGMALHAMTEDDWELARSYAERRLDDEPQSGDAWGMLGYIHYRRGDISRMNTALARATLWSWRPEHAGDSGKYMDWAQQLTARLQEQGQTPSPTSR